MYVCMYVCIIHVKYVLKTYTYIYMHMVCCDSEIKYAHASYHKIAP